MSVVTWIVLLGGNAIGLVVGCVSFARWFRNWLIKTVSAPLGDLTTTLNKTTNAIADLKTEVLRTNTRIDRHLEGNHRHG